jgi:hypothetical protein
MAFIIILALIVGIAIGYRFTSRPRKQPYFATAEYWVFLPGVEMPEQDAIMTHMISTNPYTRRGASPIGPAEGLIFSDVRLHIALVLRSKNQSAFRPDLFEDAEGAEDARSQKLSEAQSFVKLRYLSEEKLKDRRHLQFLLHAADAVSRLGQGLLVYDHTCRRVYEPAEIAEALKENFDATGAGLHVQTRWKSLGQGGRIETCGLVKVGLAEMETGAMQADQHIIATTVLQEAVDKLWQELEMPPSLEVEAFGDRFRILLDQVKGRTAHIRIMRVQAV